jgi:hypothetical protein
MADVTVFGGLDSEGEVYRKCRVTMNGRPADAVLYSRLLTEQKFVPVDRLTGATVTENTDGSVTIQGVSQELVEIVGVDPENAMTRWEIVPQGCTTCR